MTEEHSTQAEFPVPIADWLQFISPGSLPVIEISDQINPGSVRSPFADDPRTIFLLVEAVIEMIVHGLSKPAGAGAYDFRLCGKDP